MSNNTAAFIETLPVELFYRIFDNLDAATILLSVRSVSKLFQSYVNTYNRLMLNFDLISKLNLYRLRGFINPHNVISLIFSDNEHTPDQIDLFFPSIHLQEFIRLRSLTLLNIDECQLQFILDKINLNLLISFSLHIGKHNEKFTETTTTLLSSVIANQSLRKLELCIGFSIMRQIIWSTNSTIQYLTINDIVFIDDICIIFQCSPHLHTLIMRRMPTKTINDLSSICFRQLRSLTITDIHVSIDVVEIFLLLTPSLTHLKLTGGKNMLDGKRWELFIQQNLSQLNKFEFYFIEWRLTDQTPADVMLIITSFQTPFWIKDKKWFVTCECLAEYPKTIYLSSIPFCTRSAYYVSKVEKISLSTYPLMLNNNLTMTENINVMRLILNKTTADDIEEKKAITNHPLFPRVSDIVLEFRKEWPFLSLQSLFVFVDISRIVIVKICSNYFNEYDENRWMDISIFLEQAQNLSSLSFLGNFNGCESPQTTKNMYSISMRHVKHLEIPVYNINQIKMILERYENLSIISAAIDDSEFIEKVINWFAENTVDTTCGKSYMKVAVWLGKKNIQPSEINVDHDETKLTENS